LTLRGRLRRLFVDRRISTKIVSVALVVASVFAGVGVIGLVSIRDLAAQQDSQYRQHVVALAHMSAVRSAVSSQQEAVLSHILSDAGFYRDRYASIILETDQAINRDLDALHAIEKRHTRWEGLRAFESTLRMWRTARNTAITSSDLGDRQKAASIVLVRSEAIASALKDRANAFLKELVDAVQAGAKDAKERSAATGRLILILLLAGAVVAVTLAVLAARTISRPLRETSEVLARVARGDLSRRMNVNSSDEIGRMGESLNETLGVLRNAFDQLQHRASHDGLTGLANRGLLYERMALARPNAVRGIPVAVVLIDLDGFKQVNDLHGHAAGDHLLTVVSQRLLDAVRGADTVARLGGDEFCVLLDGMDHADDVYAVADRLLADIKQPTWYQGIELQPQASIGVTLWSGDAEAEALMRDADAAMYAAKQSGKGRVVKAGHPISA
jgi:diguanylate cyclase (GGDEF)-like protein